MILWRTYGKLSTRGLLYTVNMKVFETVELPWRHNWPNVSCIPEGFYTVSRDETGKHRWFKFNERQVSPRTHIEIHVATRAYQLAGCIGMLEGDLRELQGMSPTGFHLYITSSTGPIYFEEEDNDS